MRDVPFWFYWSHMRNMFGLSSYKTLLQACSKAHCSLFFGVRSRIMQSRNKTAVFLKPLIQIFFLKLLLCPNSLHFTLLHQSRHRTCQIQTKPAEAIPSEHIFVVYYALCNQLPDKKCQEDIRYEKCRPLVPYKIKDPSAGLVGNLWPYTCLCVCLVQNYNQFGYDRPSRNIKCILKETVFSNQLPRCIRQVEFQQTKGSTGRHNIDFLLFTTYQTVPYWPDLMVLSGAPCSPGYFHHQAGQLPYLATVFHICSFSANMLNQYIHTENLIRDRILNLI